MSAAESTPTNAGQTAEADDVERAVIPARLPTAFDTLVEGVRGLEAMGFAEKVTDFADSAMIGDQRVDQRRRRDFSATTTAMYRMSNQNFYSFSVYSIPIFDLLRLGKYRL